MAANKCCKRNCLQATVLQHSDNQVVPIALQQSSSNPASSFFCVNGFNNFHSRSCLQNHLYLLCNGVERPFYVASVCMFEWTQAYTCIVSMWGELQLRFRVLVDWPLKDTHRLQKFAPCRPAVMTIEIEHRLSKHADCQWTIRATLWLVRQVKFKLVPVGHWQGCQCGCQWWSEEVQHPPTYSVQCLFIWILHP